MHVNTDSLTRNSYVWRDGGSGSGAGGAVQTLIQYRPNINQNTVHNTTFTLNALGQMTSAYIADGKPRSVSFTLDEIGQIIRRDESGTISGQTGNPHEVWYRFGGRQLGYTGNNGTSDLSYHASVADRRVVGPNSPGTFRNQQVTGGAYADFAQNYDPINSYYQGAAGGTYRVNQGDSLAGIATALYGDSSLWYKIAEANGLSAAAALVEGQTLVLPTGVVKSTNNAGTFKPYNAGEAIGDLSPTTPQPPKKPKCGVFGQILLAVIAIAVVAIVGPAIIGAPAVFGAGGAVTTAATGLTAVFGGAAAAAGSAAAIGAAVVGGAIAGAVGSIVSQGVGIATGIQEKFSWKGVALGALGGAVGGALKGFDVFGKLGIGGNVAGSEFLGNVARGAVGSAINQGAAVVTGLQSKFDWAGVAAAGIGAGVAGALNVEGISKANRSIGAYASNFGASMASAIANGAARSLINGSDFGDNILAALPDVIAQTIGDMLVNGIESPVPNVTGGPIGAQTIVMGNAEPTDTVLARRRRAPAVGDRLSVNEVLALVNSDTDSDIRRSGTLVADIEFFQNNTVPGETHSLVIEITDGNGAYFQDGVIRFGRELFNGSRRPFIRALSHELYHARGNMNSEHTNFFDPSMDRTSDPQAEYVRIRSSEEARAYWHQMTVLDEIYGIRNVDSDLIAEGVGSRWKDLFRDTDRTDAAAVNSAITRMAPDIGALRIGGSFGNKTYM